MNEAGCGAGAASLLYATPNELLDMEDHDGLELERRFMQDLEHVRKNGLLDASDLQLPILASPPTAIQFIKGYEGDALKPLTPGVAGIVSPPPEGRGFYTRGDYSLQAVCTAFLPHLSLSRCF